MVFGGTRSLQKARSPTASTGEASGYPPSLDDEVAVSIRRSSFTLFQREAHADSGATSTSYISSTLPSRSNHTSLNRDTDTGTGTDADPAVRNPMLAGARGAKGVELAQFPPAVPAGMPPRIDDEGPDSDDEEMDSGDQQLWYEQQQRQLEQQRALAGRDANAFMQQRRSSIGNSAAYMRNVNRNIHGDCVGGARATRSATAGDARGGGGTHGVEDQLIDPDYFLDLSGDDDFPTEEVDILHVHYLSASRGSWDEAVGMRRMGLGYTDSEIEAFLEANHSPLHIAALLGNLDIMLLLIEHGGLDPFQADDKGNTPLHCAARRGQLRVVRSLVEMFDAPADEPNAAEMTPVMLAAINGCVSVVHYLVEVSPRKVPVTYKDPHFGAGLLHWSSLHSLPNVIEYLLEEHHIPVETKASSDGSSCLLWACYGGSLSNVKFLIEHSNANPQATNNKGWNCLHLATASGSVDKTVYLMDVVGLKITDQNGDHQTPFDVAMGKAALYLQERRAKGFVSGSVVDKARKIKKKHLK